MRRIAVKVLHVMGGAATGGGERIFMDNITALAEAGVEQCIVTRAATARRMKTLRCGGVTVETASFLRWSRAPTERTIRKTMENFRPGIVQYWMGRAADFASCTARDRNIGWHGLYYKWERFRDCGYHIAQTQDLAQQIRASNVDESKIGLIHTYWGASQAEPACRPSLDTPNDAPLLFFHARLHAMSGLDLLLDALTEIPSAYLWVVGEGPHAGKFKDQTVLRGISDRTKFLGWRRDWKNLLAACDIVALPSRYEPFNMMMIDAWAAGKPLVAIAAVGSRKYVKHEENGLLIEAGEPSAFARSIRNLIADDGLRAQIVQGGRETFESQHSKGACVRDMLAFYQKVVDAAEEMSP